MTDNQNENSAAPMPGSRALAAWEIASVVSSAFIAEWISAVATGRTRLIIAIPVSLAFLFMLASHRLHGESLRDIGLGLDNSWRALKLLLAPMLLVAILSLIIGLLSGTKPNVLRWHPERLLLAQLALGFGWGLVQQYVLQAFFNRRAQIVWGQGPISILITALIFAALHFPNPWLMLVTFVGGLLWALIYQRAPNLLALAISHSVMTWVLVSTLPASALYHLRIGFKYFT